MRHQPRFGSSTLQLAVLTAAFAVSSCGPADKTPPATPTGLNAIAGNQLVTLNWNANTEEDLFSYEVHQGTQSGSLTKVATILAPATSTVLAGLSNDTLWYFAVSAVDKAGNVSALSLESSARPFAPDVIPPTLVSSVPGAGALGVAVNAPITLVFSEDMDTLSLTVSLVPAVALGAPAWANPKTVTLQPTPAFTHGTAYTVTVSAKDAVGNALAGLTTFGFTTVAENMPPAVPTGLSAVPGNQLVTLTWEANVESDLAGYEIYQGLSETTLTRVAGVNAPATTYVAGGLTNGVTYFFSIAAKDLNGNLSERSAPSSAAPFLPDVTPPTVALATPGSATNVAVDTALLFAFSEDMDPGSVTVTMTPPPPGALGAPVWVDAKSVSFQPTAVLAFGTSYTVEVTGADLAGNALVGTRSFTFATANPPDVTLPTIVATGPAEGATGVGVSANLTFEFSEPMNPTSVQGAFTSIPAITCSWAASLDARSFTCAHAAPFAFSTAYAATMGIGAMDLAGNHLAAPTTVHFATANAPDTLRPMVCPRTGGSEPCPATSSTFPGSGATGISRSTNIVVRFSEPMNQASVQAAFAITAPAGHTTGVFTWNAAGTEVTFNPDVSFAYGDNVTWRIGTGATDLATTPNALAATFTSTFRTIRQSSVVIYSTPALDGLVDSSAYVSTAGSALAAGDGSTNLFVRGFLSFDLSGIPADVTEVSAATLYAYQSHVTGAPYTDLGELRAASVNYGTSLTAGDFETPIIRTLQCPPCVPPICQICNPLLYTRDEVVTLSTTSTVGTKSAAVARKVWDDLVNRSSRGSRSQFRLAFSLNTTADSSADFVNILSGETTNAANRARLAITYLYP